MSFPLGCSSCSIFLFESAMWAPKQWWVPRAVMEFLWRLSPAGLVSRSLGPPVRLDSQCVVTAISLGLHRGFPRPRKYVGYRDSRLSSIPTGAASISIWTGFLAHNLAVRGKTLLCWWPPGVWSFDLNIPRVDYWGNDTDLMSFFSISHSVSLLHA